MKEAVVNIILNLFRDNIYVHALGYIEVFYTTETYAKFTKD